MNKEHLQQLQTDIANVLNRREDVIFAYVYGSAVTRPGVKPRDIDIAVYLSSESYRRYSRNAEVVGECTIPLEMELEQVVNEPIDLQVLNEAPLRFRFNVVTDGKVILDKYPEIRAEFEYLSRVEFFDFQPRRKEYLREAAG